MMLVYKDKNDIKNSAVLVVGGVGLCLLFLAVTGIGTIGIIDNDTVDVLNLRQQIFHGTLIVHFVCRSYSLS